MPHSIDRLAPCLARPNAGEAISPPLLWPLLLPWLIFSGLLFCKLDVITRGVP